MLFNSTQFLVFYPLVLAAFYLSPPRIRWAVLLVASCWFYMCFIPAYILILLGTIAVDYVAGLRIEASQGSRRRAWLLASLVANIGVLAAFKYYAFLDDNLGVVASAAGFAWRRHDLGIVLPIGLSFHTFQAMSYTIEVYRGRQPAERHLGIYALYVMFYPQLVAGPIERPQNLLPQFHGVQRFEPDRVASGLVLMLWGFFKKVVVADRVAEIANAVYDHPAEHHGLAVVLAMIAFSVQIYCDFSGYSDIAIGSARTMGFELMNNFDRPYLSRSIGEFWRRWHISLSTWFKDYLYVPLGGSRVPPMRRYLNTFVVFLVSGLWHGASWTFVAWGALHGIYLVSGMITAPWRDALWARVGLPRLRDALGMVGTFGLVTVAWVFFRAHTFGAAASLFRAALDWSGQSLRPSAILARPELEAIGFPFADGVTRLDLLLSTAAILALVVLDGASAGRRFDAWLEDRRPSTRWSVSYALILAIVLFGVESEIQFIYFQF